MVDLHTHSNASDGDFSPCLLMQEAAKRGINAIALTDHDTINGLENARAFAAISNIRLIPGIEISISWANEKFNSDRLGGAPGPGGEFHLLGLGISEPSAAFLSAIGELARRREARNREIMDKMRDLNIKTDWEEFMALSGGHSLGRPHFASLLIKHKVVSNREQAFARYLGAGKPLYVPKEGLDFEVAVHLIRDSKGIPVLAHPMSLYIAWGRLPDFVKTLKNMGLMGLEAWHPTAKASACRRLELLGKSLGLYITEGSDFHGATAPGRKLGRSNPGRDISDGVLQAIPELAAGG
ncbi:MAG: PHP domain-containing protein [Spirochaetes bacterium]|nr:PHP domain-containing protein [Spirochaetota bacterium]